jgi:hypothetical protein
VHPVRFYAEHRESQSRLTTFFRLLLAIPHVVVLSLWGIAVFFTAIVAWFAVVLTGSYPRGLYDFHAGFLRFATATSGYLCLLDDRFPPFSGDPDYGVKLLIGEPQPSYDRVKALFRLILMIPVGVIAYAMGIVAQVGALIAWFIEVATGKLPRWLFDMLVLGVSYQQRAYAYYLLIDEDWPPFTDNAAEELDGGPSGGTPLPSPTTAAPPVAPERPDVPASTAPGGGSGMTGGDPLGG